ncbi:MAG TPA: 50S ribosomal protein L5 [Patescibacteria group bacterium]|nr:50S ribosomal protein L5 [Patescibacteria group bacterium]
MNQLQEKYIKEIIPAFMSKHGVKNKMAVPKLVKIVVNCGMGEALTDKKVMEKMSAQLAVITGQKPEVKTAKRAISTFKLRAGDAVGLRVTIRGKRMYDFFQKLIAIGLPRVRDFRGVPLKGFDGRGNYTMGIKEHTIFPELEYNMVDKVRGFEISFVTTAKTDEMGKILLQLLGMPFVKE